MPEQLRPEPKDLGEAATFISHSSFLIPHSSFLIMARNHNKKYGDMVTFKSFPFPPIG